MIETLEGYLEQFSGASQTPCSPTSHVNRALQRINNLSYIHHALYPEVRGLLLFAELRVMHM